MNTQAIAPVAPTSPPSSEPRQSEPDYIAKAVTVLASPRPVTEATRLVPAAVCDAVIAKFSGEEPPIGKDRAPGAVATLLAGYPQATLRSRTEGEEIDLKAYARTIARTMAGFPEYAVMGAIDGKPWKHGFLPSEPEVREALQAEVTRRAVVVANAKAHKREARRRDDEARENERIAAGRGATESERKLQIQNILAKFNRMDEAGI